MRQVVIAGRKTSALGFGCASLGSRISEVQGLRALDEAYENGVRWFDLAPAYGAGHAEGIFGRFLIGRNRDEIGICTKVGLAPPRQSTLTSLARTVLRPVVAAAGPLRATIRKSGATANHRVPLTPELVREGLEQSLRRMGIDHVDVYALHNALPEDLDRDDILRALEALRTAGKTRALAVAGGADVAEAVATRETPFDIVQFAQPRQKTGAALMSKIETRALGCITHSVFGVAGTLREVTRRLQNDAGLRERIAEAGFDGSANTSAANMLIARAFASNARGVVLASMFSQHSLSGNLAAARAPLRPVAMRLCSELGV